MKQTEFFKLATQTVEDFKAVIRSMPWENQQFYSTWLVQTNAFVAHTSDFLQMCNDLLPASHPLKAQFAHHQEEEAGHERMSENDVKFMGIKQPEIFPVTNAFWKGQYYWIQTVSPTSHLGYALFLEGLAAKAGPIVLQKVKEAGFKGYTFLKVHVEEDQEHFEDGLNSLAKVTDQERADVYRNLLESKELYLEILKSCERSIPTTKKVAA